MRKKSFLVTMILMEVLAQEKVRYDNYKVYTVLPTNTTHLNILRNLERHGEYNFWTDIKNVAMPVDVMVPPHLSSDFQDLISNHKMSSSLKINNVQDKIERLARKRRSTVKQMDWYDYHDGEEINAFLKQLSETYPGKVKLLNIGKTYENRNIIGVHVTFSKRNAFVKKSVFIEGGMHAREWISPATVTFILNELITSPNTTIRHIAHSFDWYFFPVINADGYAYTFAKERLWRKTRKPYGCKSPDYDGVDPNRNWDIHWEIDSGRSNDPCSEIYGGPTPFSENCTRVLSNFISTIGYKLLGYINFHSYSQLLLFPYGHTKKHLDNYDELKSIGNKALKSLASRYGTSYKIGNIAELLYITSGTSMEWVRSKFKTRIVYSYELRDKGKHGFLLPPEEIIPTALETLDSFITMFQEVLKLPS